MNRRMESMKLMVALQPFTQLGVIKADKAKTLVDDYKEGHTESLRNFTMDPTLPVSLQPLIDKVAQFI